MRDSEICEAARCGNIEETVGDLRDGEGGFQPCEDKFAR